MKKQSIITLILTTGLLISNYQNGMAFKGIGKTMGSSHGVNSTAKNSTEQQNMTIEGHEGNRNITVAKVNDAPVTMGALVDSVREIMMTKYGKAEVTEDIARTIRKDAFEKLVLEELACQRAGDLGITVQPEIIKKVIDSRIAAAGGDDKFQKILEQQNTTLQAFERQTERFFLIKQLIYQDIDAKVDISEETLEKAYEANREKFAEPERVKINDIIFFLDPNDPTSKQKVLDIRLKIIDELSGNPAKLNETGVFVKTGLNITADFKPLLYKQSMKLKQGAFSDPILIDGTLHLIQLESYHPRKEKPKEKVKKYIASQMIDAEKSIRLPQWRNKLLRDGKVEIVHDILK
jgi:parvulin-like peptidyl-prolyl isomerase